MALGNKTSSRKSRALKYASRGLRVVAMHSVKEGRCGCSKGEGCDRPGKHPMTAHGVNDATTDRNRINTWWTESPNANIGIATGSEAGILVFDIDPRNKGKETLARLKKELGPLPDTVTVITGGGGRHLVFQYPPFPVRKDTSGKVFGPGIDVLSDGCIVIAPPSVHASGNRYRCVKGKAYRNREPAPFPQPWLDRLRGDAPAQAKADSVPAAQVDGLITEGRRNNCLTSFRRNVAAQRRVA
jgi:putative DNA primase/helicase